MINLRTLRRPASEHPDFQMYAIGGYADKNLINVNNYSFLFCWWGGAGGVSDLDSPNINKVTWGLIKDNTGQVREIFEKIPWKEYSEGGMGAPRLQPYHLVQAYTECVEKG